MPRNPCGSSSHNSSRMFEADIETISSYISYNPPDTSGELLRLRELQHKYREMAASIRNEIDKLG